MKTREIISFALCIIFAIGSAIYGNVVASGLLIVIMALLILLSYLSTDLKESSERNQEILKDSEARHNDLVAHCQSLQKTLYNKLECIKILKADLFLINEEKESLLNRIEELKVDAVKWQALKKYDRDRKKKNELEKFVRKNLGKVVKVEEDKEGTICGFNNILGLILITTDGIGWGNLSKEDKVISKGVKKRFSYMSLSQVKQQLS